MISRPAPRRRGKSARGAFKIETITKVGVPALLGAGARGEATPPPAPGPAGFAIGRRGADRGRHGARSSRRAGSDGWRRGARPASLLAPPPARSPEIVGLMQQALIAMRQSGREPLNQAIGLYRRVVTLQPDYADGWGALAIAYAEVGPRHRAERARRRPAARPAPPRTARWRSTPGTVSRRAGRVLLLARIGNWWTPGAGGYAQPSPTTPMRIRCCSSSRSCSARVGRSAEDARADRARPPDRPAADRRWCSTCGSRSCGRSIASTRPIARSPRPPASIPANIRCGFTRFYMLLYTGRAQEAVAFCEDRSGRPTGIPDVNFDKILVAAKAVASGDRAAIAAAVAAQLRDAHEAAGYAEKRDRLCVVRRRSLDTRVRDRRRALFRARGSRPATSPSRRNRAPMRAGTIGAPTSCSTHPAPGCAPIRASIDWSARSGSSAIGSNRPASPTTCVKILIS